MSGIPRTFDKFDEKSIPMSSIGGGSLLSGIAQWRRDTDTVHQWDN